MTVDELIKLTEGLSAGFTVQGIVTGQHAGEMAAMDPEVITILVRFLGGERPTAPQPTVPPGTVYVDLTARAADRIERANGVDVEAEPEELPKFGEDGKRLTREQRWLLSQRAPRRPERPEGQKTLPLAGEFDGVELP